MINQMLYFMYCDTWDPAISITHADHQLLVAKDKTISYFMKIFGSLDSIKQKVDKCIPCHANSPGNHPFPYQMSPLPPKPWHTIYTDYCGPLLLVRVCCHPWCILMIPWGQHCTVSVTITMMDRLCFTHGISLIARSDHCPQSTGDEIEKYMEENRIKNCTSKFWGWELQDKGCLFCAC